MLCWDWGEGQKAPVLPTDMHATTSEAEAPVARRGALGTTILDVPRTTENEQSVGHVSTSTTNESTLVE